MTDGPFLEPPPTADETGRTVTCFDPKYHRHRLHDDGAVPSKATVEILTSVDVDWELGGGAPVDGRSGIVKVSTLSSPSTLLGRRSGFVATTVTSSHSSLPSHSSPHPPLLNEFQESFCNSPTVSRPSLYTVHARVTVQSVTVPAYPVVVDENKPERLRSGSLSKPERLRSGSLQADLSFKLIV